MDNDGVGCVIGIIVYLYVSLCIFVIAQKTGTDNAWFAFVPILDIVLLVQIADKPIWWVVGFFIPIVNIFVAALVWMGVAEVRGKPHWLGILMLIPGVNLAVMAYLTFSR